MSLTIKPNTTVVTLLQGDDLDPIVSQSNAVTQAVTTQPMSRVGDGEDETTIPPEVEAFNEFMDDVEDRAVKVRLTQLPRKQYKTLRNEHPPRMEDSENGPTEHSADARWGFNSETFGDVLVPRCVELGQLDPEDDAGRRALTTRMADGTYTPSVEVEEFLDSLSDGWFSKLYAAAISLNQGAGPDPKLRISSRHSQTSDETSDSHDRLA